MHRLARAVLVGIVIVTGLGGALSSAGAAVQSAAPVATITAVTPSPYLAASDTLTVTGTTSAATDAVSVALTPTAPLTTVSGTATVTAAKTWSVTFTKTQLGNVTDGTVTVTATSTAAGQSGTATRTFVKDTVVPALSSPAVTPALMGSANLVATVSGTVNASTTVGAAGEAGDVVTISADDTDTATAPVTATVTSGSGGAFSTTVNTASLTDGTITYTYVARDAAGNPSAAMTRTNTKDATPPPAPTVQVAPTPIVNASKAAVTVSGTSTGSTAVAISITDGVHTPVTASATVSSNAYSKTPIDVTSLNDGTLTVSVTASDAAGNVGPAGSTTVLKDTAAPTTTLVVPAYITPATVSAVPVSGDSESGATIAVKAVAAGTTTPSVTGSATVASNGHWTLSLNTSGLAEGDITITATPTDVAGNPGTVVTRTSTKDTTAPAAPATLTASPSPYSTGTFTVAGTTAFNDRAAALTVDITITDVLGTALTATAQPVTTGSSAGTFSVPFTAAQMSTLSEGALTVTAVLRDAAGNVGPATTANAENGLLRLVSSTPAAGTSVRPPGTVSATYNQALSSTGTTTTSSIQVRNSTGATIAGTTAINGTTITFTPAVALSDGTYNVTVTAYDKMYTTQQSTDTFSFTAATTPLVPPQITFFTQPVTAANQANVVVSGTADLANKTVTVTIGSFTKTVIAASDKTWSTTFNLSDVADGTLTASATQSDGTSSSTASTRDSYKDASAPVKASSVPAAGATVAMATSVRMTFDQDLGSSSTMTIPGVTGTTTIGGSVLTFKTSTPIAEGTYTATANLVDDVGNTSTATVTFTVKKTASSVTLEPLPALIVIGQSITLRGQVTQGATATYGNLVLQAVTDAGQVVSLGTVKPGSSGAFVKTIKPTVNATYQVGYAGDTANTASVSPKRATDVAAKVTASSPRGKATAEATVSGVVTPSNNNTVVTVFKLVNGQRVRLGTADVNAQHRYTFQVKLPKGTTRLVVTVAATANNAAGSVEVNAVRT